MLKSKNTVNYKIVCQFVGFNIIITLILLIRKKREERSIPVTSSETFKDIYFERVRQGFSFLYPSLLSSSAVEKGRQNPGIGLGINLSLDGLKEKGYLESDRRNG